MVRGPEAEAVSALFFVFWKKKKCEGAKLRVEGSKQKLRHGQIPKATRVKGLPRREEIRSELLGACQVQGIRTRSWEEMRGQVAMSVSSEAE